MRVSGWVRFRLKSMVIKWLKLDLGYGCYVRIGARFRFSVMFVCGQRCG